MNFSEIIFYAVSITAVIALPYVTVLVFGKKHRNTLKKTLSVLDSVYLLLALCILMYSLRYSSMRALFLSGLFAAGRVSAAFAYAGITNYKN